MVSETNPPLPTQRLTRGFDTVLIDEACQCSEIAALQPLVYGAEKVHSDVMVCMDMCDLLCVFNSLKL